MPRPPVIRPLAPGELAAAQEIDRYRRAGLAWAAADEGDEPGVCMRRDQVQTLSR